MRFIFIHKSNPSLVYTAVCEGDKVRVSWRGSSKDYTLEEAKFAVDNGHWVVIRGEVPWKADESKENTCDTGSVEDVVNHPIHYNTGNIEVIDYIEDKLGMDGFLDYCIGNVMKYVSRYKYKNGVQDLQKAEWYLRRAIQTMTK